MELIHATRHVISYDCMVDTHADNIVGSMAIIPVFVIVLQLWLNSVVKVWERPSYSPVPTVVSVQ